MVSIVAFELQRLQWNSYFDPKTGLLKNLVNATTQEELDQEEVRAATIMETVMKSNPPKNTGDLAELLEIYRQLFSHVYPWAGKIRIVNLSKQVDAKHAFTDVSHIEQEMREEAARLRNDNLLQDLDENRFIEKMTSHFVTVNRIHPFREGNGRTQRLFWTLIAQEAGHPIDRRNIDGTWMIRASRKSMDDDLEELRNLLEKVVVDGRESESLLIQTPASHL